MIVDAGTRNAKYEIIKKAAKGTINDCPFCGQPFKKTRRAQKFCSNICKDGYWNNKKKY